jgi:tetratricopeptide (TPR) repeat protein
MARVQRDGTTGAWHRGSWARTGRERSLCVAALVALVAATGAADVPSSGRPGPSDGAAALAVCYSATTLPKAERIVILDRAYTLGDAALTADPDDPLAHFAVFCALGRRLETVGFSLGAMRAFRRMRVEVDATLALAPDFADALIGKGAMLGEAPRIAGGDLDESERLLRRGADLAPTNPDAFFRLGRTLLAVGRRDEARAAAERGLALAQQQGNPMAPAVERLVADTR